MFVQFSCNHEELILSTRFLPADNQTVTIKLLPSITCITPWLVMFHLPLSLATIHSVASILAIPEAPGCTDPARQAYGISIVICASQGNMFSMTMELRPFLIVVLFFSLQLSFLNINDIPEVQKIPHPQQCKFHQLQTA